MPGVDSHAHVFGGPEYPFAAEASYRPIPAEHGTARGFLAVLDAHGLAAVLVILAVLRGSACQPWRGSRLKRAFCSSLSEP